MSKIQVVWFRDLTRWDTEYFMGNHSLHSKFKLEYLSKILTPRKEKIKPDEYDGITPIVAKIPFQSSHIELRKEPRTKMDMYAIYKGDLLVSNINFHQGAIAICKESKIYASTHYQPYITNNALVNSEFLLLVLKQNSYQQYISAKKTRGIKTESNFNFIKNLQIPLPPLEIQNKIVADIHAIDAKIKALQEEEKRLKDEIEVYIYIALGLQKPQIAQKQKVFTVRFKNLDRWDTNYNQNANSTTYNNTKHKKYPIVHLGETIAHIDTQTQIPTEEHFFYVGLENIKRGGLDFEMVKENSNTIKSASLILKKGYIYYSKLRPYLKKIFYYNYDQKSYASSELIGLKFKDDIYPEFVLNLLVSNFITQQEQKTSGARMPRVNLSDIKNFKIPLPPLDTQKEIVEYIEQKTALIQNLATQRTTLHNSIESKLQEMLTN